jgi:CRP-like cAMP-binding protein
MLAERIPASAGQTVFSAGEPATALYLLITGSVDLYDVISDLVLPGGSREFFLDSIGPGEVFGISALVEPYSYTLTARAATDLDLVRLDGAELRRLLGQHADLAQAVLGQTTKTLAGRLRDTRVLLAAARA